MALKNKTKKNDRKANAMAIAVTELPENEIVLKSSEENPAPKKKTAEKVTVSLRIDAEMKDRLTKFHDGADNTRHRNQSGIITDAIEEYLSSRGY